MSDVIGWIERWYSEIWNRWAMDPVEELAESGFEWKTAFRSQSDRGHDRFWAHMGQMKAAFGDLSAHVDTSRDVPRVVWRGTHTGHIWGVEGTGTSIEVVSPLEADIRDGKFARLVETTDWTTVLAKVGASLPVEAAVPLRRVIPAFRTADWNRSRVFYIQKLGFRVLFEWRHGVDFPCFAGIERDGAVIHISEHGQGPIHAMGITVEVDDAQAFYEDVTHRGISLEPPRRQPWGNTELMVTDPDGHGITFSEFGD